MSQKPQLTLGQTYYENERKSSVLSARHYKVQVLFKKLLEKWLWQEENKPKRQGDVLKLMVNENIYFFVAIPNDHGVIRWSLVVDPTTVLIEKVLK